MPNWNDYIHSDPGVLQGKPVVRGTRLAVDFILGLFAAGWAEQEVLDSYPTLTRDALRAVFAFSAECMREEALPARYLLGLLAQEGFALENKFTVVDTRQVRQRPLGN